MYSTVRISRLYEQIVDQIQERIVGGELSPGDRLPAERELAEQFGVSRTAVREAVKAMCEKGLVEVHPGRGTFIADITDSTTQVVRGSLSLMVGVSVGDGMGDLTQVRAILEPEIAAIAARQAREKELQALHQAVRTMDAALENCPVFIEADLDFHLALARGTQNSLIPILIDPVIGLLREQRERIFRVPGGPQRGQYHHKRILAAVEARDPAAARQAMVAHLAQVEADSETARQMA